MVYTALKPCRFAGQSFRVGDEVPASLVLNPGDQEKMGVLARFASAPVEPSADMELRVPIEAGGLALEVGYEGLQAVFSAITAKAAEAEDILEHLTDPDALLLLSVCDSRKSIKEAAKDRAGSLTESEAGEAV